MIPPKPIGLFESRTENERLNTFNYRVGQETYEPTVNPIIRDTFFKCLKMSDCKTILELIQTQC